LNNAIEEEKPWQFAESGRWFNIRIVAGIPVLLLLLFTGSTEAATWTVDDSGKANYAQIQDAIDNASAGDTILVNSGTYYENVDVNKQLTLLGIDNGGGKPVVNGGKNYSVFAVTLGAGWSTLDGFTARYARSGILVNSNNNTIRNNTVLNNGDNGIYILNSKDNIIKNNTILNNGNGIHLVDSSYNMLIDNTVNSNNGNVGIFLFSSSNNMLIGNTVTKFPLGISILDPSSNNTIYNNFFNNNNNAVSNSINNWNITETQGINIAGGPYIGGNAWANPRGKGFSQACKDVNIDGICDSPYKLESSIGITNIDHLPLAYKPASPKLMNIVFIISVLAVALIAYLKRKEIEKNMIMSSIKDAIKGAIFGTISGGIIGFVLLLAIAIKSGGNSDVMLGGLMLLALGAITGAITGIIGYACKDAVVGAIFGAVGGLIFGYGMSRINLIGNVPGGAFLGAIVGSIIAGAFFGISKNAMTGTIVGGVISGMSGGASFGDIIGGFTGGALFGAIVGSVIGGIFLGRIIAAISLNRDTISGALAGAISGSFTGLISGVIFGPSLSSIVIWIISPIGGAIIGGIIGVLIGKSNDAISRAILGGAISGAIFGVVSSKILDIIDTGTITDAFWMGGMDAIYPVILGAILGAIVGATSNYSFLRRIYGFT
jgi:parallel beta-helix repeat protein